MIGTNKYIRGSGALFEVGEWARLLGEKALVIGGKTALSISRDSLYQSLDASGIEHSELVFTQDVTESQSMFFAKRAEEDRADLVIGVGGGKAIDVSKWAADRAGIPYIAVPTSAATCAAAVSLYIAYTEEERPVGGGYAARSPDFAIVDSKVIAEAPARLMASGIADTMSKWPETSYGGRNQTRTVFIDATEAWAKVAFDVCLKEGPGVIQAVRENRITKELEDVIDANMILSGVTGNTAGHEVRLAVAHCVHDGLITYDFEKSKKYLHGEKVAFGTLVQMVLCENITDDLFLQTFTFMKSAGLPVCMKDLGIDETGENVRKLAVETRRRKRLQEGPVATPLEHIVDALSKVNSMAKEIVVPSGA